MASLNPTSMSGFGVSKNYGVDKNLRPSGYNVDDGSLCQWFTDQD